MTSLSAHIYDTCLRAFLAQSVALTTVIPLAKLSWNVPQRASLD